MWLIKFTDNGEELDRTGSYTDALKLIRKVRKAHTSRRVYMTWKD